MPVRLGPAEESLIAQLQNAGAVDAAERLRVSGLPTRKVEHYHYTDLKTLLRQVPDTAGIATETSAPAIRIPGSYRVMLVNGVLEGAGKAPAGTIVGKIDGSPLTTRDDVIVRLNQALVTESLSIELNASVDPVVHVDHRIEGVAGHLADGVRVYLGEGGSATLVETFSGSNEAHLGNHGTYIAVGAGATLTHIQIDLSGKNVRHFATTEYELAENANLRTLTIHAGADLARSQIYARFSGQGSHADLTGLNLTDDGQHKDITLHISHAVPNTTSTESYKQIARGRSKAVFQGKIVVERDAQKTDAKLNMQGLMLSDEAEILSKPELEIFADDVVCGHGSTCGDLDADSLFYLMSRGIARKQATSMLVRGLIAELFDPVADEELREVLLAVSDGWLEQGD